MKYLLFLFASALGAQTLTSISYDSLSHSTLRVNAVFTGTVAQIHIRYIDTTATPGGVCTDGTSGVAVQNEYAAGNSGPTYGAYQLVVGGLTPGHVYNICMQANSSNGGTFTTGGPSLTITMPSLPAIHPALPIAPITFPTTDTDTATPTNLTLGGTNCANVQACLQYMIPNQLTTRYVVTVPAGVSASSIGAIGPFGGESVFPISPDAVVFASSQVNTTTNSISVTAHGLTEGQKVQFGASYGCLPGNGTATSLGGPLCEDGTRSPTGTLPFPPHTPFRIHKLDNNTFQVYSCPGQPTNEQGCTFASGTLLTFSDTGSGSMRYAPSDDVCGNTSISPCMHSITFVTSDLANLPPAGSMLEGPPDGSGVPTRPTQYVPHLGNMQNPTGASYPLIALGNSNTDPFTKNIRFVGIHFGWTDTTEGTVSGDPTPGSALIYTGFDSGNTTFDRCYFDSPATPFRTGNGIFNLNGYNNGYFGNYVTGMEFWHANNGIGVSGSGDSLTLNAGSAYFGGFSNTILSGSTVNWAAATLGSSSRIWLYTSPSGHLQIAAPPPLAPTLGYGFGSGRYVSGTSSGTLYPLAGGSGSYLVDPIVSTSASCSSPTSPLAAQSLSAAYYSASGAQNVGMQFIPQVQLYLCSARWYKPSAETATSHTFTLWTLGGASLGSLSTSGETASGWQQTPTLSSGIPLNSGVSYVISLFVSVGTNAIDNLFSVNYSAANILIPGLDYYGHIVNLAATGPGMEQNGSFTYPLNHQPTNYFYDPVIAASSAACSGATNSLMININWAQATSFSGAYTLGTQFTNDTAQYLCAIRYTRSASETGSTHTFGLWNAAGTLVYSYTGATETSSGPQVEYLPVPQALSAATVYTVGANINASFTQCANCFRNADLVNAGMHLTGQYANTDTINGDGYFNDAWPRDYVGNVYGGPIAWVDVNTSGSVLDASPASTYTTLQGGNTMTSGCGPGPWMQIGNFISAAGLPWHFDDSCQRFEPRADYTISRNYRYGPRYTFYGTAYSNGLDYTWRQPLEWKGGNRIRIYGDIFDGSIFEGGSKAMIALQSPQEVNCVTDADVMFNTFKHGPGTLGGGLEYGRGTPMSCPPVSTRYAQNMAWDITGGYSVSNSGTGWTVSGQIAAQDVIYDHNTHIWQSGGDAEAWSQAEFNIEGASATNNILGIDSSRGGMSIDTSVTAPSGITDPCTSSGASLLGYSLATCRLTPNLVWKNNLLIGINGSTSSQISGFGWAAPNYLPSGNTPDLLGFRGAGASWSLTTPDPDLHLLSSSVWRSGGGNPTLDLRDMGADVDLVLDMQGRVTVSGYGATSSTAGYVSVRQPDTGTCYLSYGSDQTFAAGTNTLASQACTPGPVTFTLSGLTANTVVYWKYFGAVQQPQGQFRTQQ